MDLKKPHKNIVEYDLLRVILTLLVIIAHCTYFKIISPYGGCDYTMFTLPKMSILYRLFLRITGLIYTFHMPLYMALSGALFKAKNRGGVIAHIGI